MQKELRKKRNEYLIGIVNQFEQSDEAKSIFDCYDYVKTVANLQINDFLKTLSTEERKVIENRPDLWFVPLESISTFEIFLTNNNKISFLIR